MLKKTKKQHLCKTSDPCWKQNVFSSLNLLLSIQDVYFPLNTLSSLHNTFCYNFAVFYFFQHKKTQKKCKKSSLSNFSNPNSDHRGGFLLRSDRKEFN